LSPEVPMRIARQLPLAFLSACLLAAGPAAADPTADPARVPADPAALQREIASSHLEPARAVAVRNLNLNAGLARFDLEDGVLLPASRVGGRSIEMVFLGTGRISVEPPD